MGKIRSDLWSGNSSLASNGEGQGRGDQLEDFAIIQVKGYEAEASKPLGKADSLKTMQKAETTGLGNVGRWQTWTKEEKPHQGFACHTRALKLEVELFIFLGAISLSG